MFRENVHKADLGNGYYLNPILDGDYADPAVFREGDNFYLCVSTGSYLPGLTIFHSKDLVNWSILCNPLRKFGENSFEAWAPDILKYKDKYYIYYCANGSNYVLWSDKIDSGWSDPIDLKVGLIDPGHVVDDEGNRYLILSTNHIVKLSDDGLKVESEPRKLFDTPHIPEEWEVEGEYPEAPNIFKKDGYYYLTYADGGTSGPATSHMIMSARARSLEGPWEFSPYNPVVCTRSRTEKWISKGHGHFVEDMNGKWWVIYHAYENGYDALGRKLLLSPVEFTEDGWFKVNQRPDDAYRKPLDIPKKEEKSIATFADLNELDSKWKIIDTYAPDKYSLTENMELLVKATGTNPGNSSAISFITGDHSYEMTACVTRRDPGTKCGLLVQYNKNVFNGIGIEDGHITIYLLGKLWVIGEAVDTEKIWFKLVNNDQYLSHYYSLDGVKYKKMSQMTNLTPQCHNAYGGFVGLRPGLYAFGEGEACFGEFYYQGKK